MSSTDIEGLIRLCRDNINFLNPVDHYEANELQCLTWYGKEDGKVLVRAAIIPNKNRFRVLAEGAAEWKANLDMNTVVIQAMLENLQSRVALFANAFVGKLGENVEIDAYKINEGQSVEDFREGSEIFIRDGRLLAKSELMGVKPFHIKDMQEEAGKQEGTTDIEKSLQTDGNGGKNEKGTTELESQADDFLHVENEF